MDTQPKTWRVKVYLDIRTEPGTPRRDARYYTGWTYLLATERTQIGELRLGHADLATVPVYHYVGEYADGSDWRYGTIDAFANPSQVTFRGKFSRHERLLNGPYHYHESDND